MLEVQLRLQRPSGDGQGSQEGAALGRRTCTTGGEQMSDAGEHQEVQGLQGALLWPSEEARSASVQVLQNFEESLGFDAENTFRHAKFKCCI